MTARLEGQKVRLRPLKAEDAPAIARWLADPEIATPLARRAPQSAEGAEGYLARIARSQSDVNFGICALDGRLIGVCGLKEIEAGQASLGIFIGEKREWGQGYGTEATRLLTAFAFEALDLHRVWLHVASGNARARRSYEKVGFREEETLRDGLEDGPAGPTLRMGISRG